MREEGGLSGYPEPDRVGSRLGGEKPRLHRECPTPHGLSTAMHQRRDRSGGRRGHRRRRPHRRDGLRGPGNNLGHSGRKAIIVLNDNGRSYAPTASRLGESLSRFRASSTYLRNRERLERLIQDVPLVGNYLERGVGGAKAALREMFEPPGVLRAARRALPGPYDGHDDRGRDRSSPPATSTNRSWSTS